MTTKPYRIVLEGVPRVNFYEGGERCPEDIPFPSVMRALMEYFNEEEFGCRVCHSLQPGSKINCSYAFFIGVSGVASFLSWAPGWAENNVEISHMSDDPGAPFDRALLSTGYEYQVFTLEKDRDNETIFRQAIMESIQSGRPVLAFGPIGPPEAAIIIGYDQGGDVLIGWSFFQEFEEFNAGVEFEPSGQFRKRDWFNYPLGFSFFVFGEKKEMPPLSESVRQALEWMVQITHTPKTYGDRHNGLAAYQAWTEHLQRDEDFPTDEAVLRQRHDVHNTVVGMVAEARWYGSQFLIQASDPDILHFSMAEDLLHAAACYASEHALMWQLWDLIGGIGNPEAYRHFADPEIRQKMLPIIKKAREKNSQAAEHISRALINK